MVKHIVLYTLKEGVDKDAAVRLVASKLEPLVGKIPGLLHMEIRRGFNGMDYALYSNSRSRRTFLPTGRMTFTRKQRRISIICWKLG